jgi:hypothetical protein
VVQLKDHFRQSHLFENYLGLRLTEQIVLNDGSKRDHTGTKGRFHHGTYALDCSPAEPSAGSTTGDDPKASSTIEDDSRPCTGEHRLEEYRKGGA